MNHAPAITVLMPVFNGAAHLREAVDSVLAGTFHDFELLAIDDGSTDGSTAILASYGDPRLRVIRHDVNRGLVASLNEGIDLARGRFIARMDADDAMLPTRLAEQCAALDANPGISVVASRVALMNADGEATGTWAVDAAVTSEAEIRAMMPRTNCIAHPSVMMRTTVARRYRYRPEQAGAEDWDLWLRLLSDGHRIAKLPTPLLRYRIHGGSVMAGTKRGLPLERRLLSARSKHLVAEWMGGRLRACHVHLVAAQIRNLSGHLVRHVVPSLARDAYRIVTYSPFRLLNERTQLKRTLATWEGRHLFLFLYLGRGGAERVHLDILDSVRDERPLVLFTGFSSDRGNAGRFAEAAQIVEIPRLVNHPFTRHAALAAIARALSAKRDPVLFASLSGTFFDLLPLLDRRVRTIWLQHAFLFQPDGNRLHKAWLPFFGRVDHYAFVSGHAKREFERFLIAGQVPRSAFGKLLYLPNAVNSFGNVRDHERVGVLFLGRDSEEKRLHLFLRIAAEVNAARPGRFSFTAIGPEARSTDGVTFTGPIDDRERLMERMAGHDVLCSTSSREGFPMAIMEAMAQGLAILSTPVGDVPHRLDVSCAGITSSVEADVVVREMSGLLLELEADRSRLRDLRDAALRKARAEFDPSTFRERYRSLLMAPAASH